MLKKKIIHTILKVLFLSKKIHFGTNFTFKNSNFLIVFLFLFLILIFLIFEKNGGLNFCAIETIQTHDRPIKMSQKLSHK